MGYLNLYKDNAEKFTPKKKESSIKPYMPERSSFSYIPKHEPIKKESSSDSIRVFDAPKEKKESVKNILLGVTCGIGNSYGDSSRKGYFKTENLFSELVSDYQRAAARFNLGIGDEYSLVWGNISGNIGDQEGLVDFLTDLLDKQVEQYLKDISGELEKAFKSKANILSPEFEGEPTVPTPNIDDVSRKIANTEWVKAAIGEVDSVYLRNLKLSQDYMFSDDSPQEIKLTWSFYGDEKNENNVQELAVNGKVIPVTDREYIFSDVKDSFMIHFYYKIDNKAYHKYLVFSKVIGYYYGTSLDTLWDTKTAKNQFIVDSGDNNFVYLLIPQDNDARLSVDNIYGGFERDVENEHMFNTDEGTVQYYLYKTVNSGLGKLHINYDKQQTNKSMER